MFRKILIVFCSLALVTGLTFAGGSAEMVPCERPLKHLNCEDLARLEKTKNCKVPVAVAPVCPEPVVCADPVECPPPVVLPPVVIEVVKLVSVPAPVCPGPSCAEKDFVRQWNIQAVGGQNNFVGLQGRFKNFGLRAGQFDLNDVPNFGTEQVVLASTSIATSIATLDSRRQDDNPVTICHKGRTIVVDNNAVPGHLGHGDTVGACQDDDDPNDCDDNICREECPQNCDDDPPSCDDGICRTECPQNCDDNPPSCDDGVCREECPNNCSNPEPPKRRALGRVETGKAYTIEGLFFIPLPDNCSNFSLYVGGGVTRKTEQSLLQDINTGQIFRTDKDNVFKPSVTAGGEYRFKVPIVVGAGYSSASGFLLHAGYSYRFK